MMPGRSFLDRALKRIDPRPVKTFAPPPREVSSGLWVLDRNYLHFGLALLPSRTTIIRLNAGKLVVISPPPLMEATAAREIDSLGVVGAVVIPNSFHYLYAKAFVARHPAAKLLAAPGLIDRVPGLGAAEDLGSRPPAAWANELEYIVLGPVRGLSEVILFHTRSGTLVLTDLAFNLIHYPRSFDRFFWRLSGVPARFGPGRTSRSLLLKDRSVATRCLEQVLDWPIERIVVAHGEMVVRDPKAELRRAFRRYSRSSAEG